MPKLAPTGKEIAERTVKACISNNTDLYGLSDDVIATKLGLTPRAYKERRKDPGKFTLPELWALSKALKLTPVQAAGIALGRPLTSKEVKDFILM